MIIKKIYDESSRTQKVWYDSKMIAYSEMVEDEYENKGNLFITFRNGTTYVYKNVDFTDYILFLSGGIDASQGKTLNKVIKTKYEYEKVNGLSIEEIQERLRQAEDEENNAKSEEKANNNEKEKTYFISGHRNLTEEEFEKNYVPVLKSVVEAVPEAKFIVGDCIGADIMAQNYLIDTLGVDPQRITVYCHGNVPEYVNKEIINFKTGYNTDIEKDAAMTEISSKDIAFVRDIFENSGTAQNILRRHLLT